MADTSGNTFAATRAIDHLSVTGMSSHSNHPRLKALAVAAFFASLAGGALAQPRGDIPGAYAGVDSIVITGCDQDRDFTTTRAEMAQCIEALYAIADADRSGTVSYLELEAFRAKAMGTDALPPYRLEFDRDQSMSVTPAEFAQVWLARFDARDPDKTGRVARSQLYRTMPRPDFSAMRRPPGGGGPPGGMPPGGRPPF